jgi:CHAT domain
MLDFEIEISSGEGRSYQVAARSHAGDISAIPVHFPFDELALACQLQAVELALLSLAAATRQLIPAEEQSVRQFGRQLFEFVFPPELRAHLSASRQQAAQETTSLRVRLRVGPAELAALPWELLYDPSREEYLCLSTPLVRYLDVLEPRRPLAVSPPLRILGMVARPHDLDSLDVEQEKQQLQHALAALERAGRVQLTWVEGQTWWDLQRSLDQGSWQILHFIGHSGFDREAGEGILALAGEDSRVHRLGANDLALLLAEHRSLRLMVLNSCDSARASGTDRFSSTAAVLVRRGIPAVVAMQYAISDQAAITFARGFYTAIAAQHPIELAVTRARRAVKLGRSNSLEWATPVLYLRSSHGNIFDLTDIAAPPKTISASVEPIPAKLRAHFEPRARGVLPFGTLLGWYFCGRVRALSEIVGWLSDVSGGDARARLVTGRPGSGKSAVLGRLVVMSHPELRSRVPPGEIERVPAGTVCPLGAIHSVVYAHGLTVDEVAAAVACEVGIAARDSETLLLALSDRNPSPPLGVVVDAVDEAAAPERLVRELLAPLARIADQAGVRLVVGTRPGQGRRFVRAFGRDALEVDLDSATYLEAEDLIDYAERLLLMVGEDQGRSRSRATSTPYRRQPELAPTVARAVAARAGRSFLVAHLASLALALAPDVVDTT